MLEPDIIQKLRLRYPGIEIEKLMNGLESARNPSALLTARVKEAASKRGSGFAIAVFKHLWDCHQVPTAKQMADWIEARTDRPVDWKLLVDRLRVWPEGKRYPPIPDDDALSEGIAGDSTRWWTPGAHAGQWRGPLIAALRNTRLDPSQVEPYNPPMPSEADPGF